MQILEIRSAGGRHSIVVEGVGVGHGSPIWKFDVVVDGEYYASEMTLRGHDPLRIASRLMRKVERELAEAA